MNLINMKTRTDELAAETCAVTQQTNESELNGNATISWTMISVVNMNARADELAADTRAVTQQKMKLNGTDMQR